MHVWWRWRPQLLLLLLLLHCLFAHSNFELHVLPALVHKVLIECRHVKARRHVRHNLRTIEEENTRSARG